MGRKMKRTSLGKRLGRLRQERDLSLDALANETGLKKEYLERVEQDEVIPPVSVLLTLARSLELDTGELLKDEADLEDKRAEAVAKRTDNYSYTVLTPASRHKHLKAFLVEIDPASDLEPTGYQHEGEEFHYMLKGQVQVTVGENLNLLQEGDTLHFNSNITHKLRNTGDETCKLLVVLFTP